MVCLVANVIREKGLKPPVLVSEGLKLISVQVFQISVSGSFAKIWKINRNVGYMES